ncbi:MAG: hypothetical protein Q9165_007948 [Trypethelium subeluteriae]
MSSPLDRRASPFSQPASWKTNVNRAKTKRWVEAKSYAYDGDDWGEADEFDEYGGPSNEDPNAANRPTGFRQKGQAPQSPGPVTSDSYPQQSLNRTRSFEPGDERRALSGTNPPGVNPPRPTVDTAIPPSRAPAQQTPNINPRPQPTVIPPNQPRARRTDSLGWESASNASVGSSSADFQQRRDFSPSAMPPPLATRASPIPESGIGMRHPPRKSSLSQQSPVRATSPSMQPISVSGDRSMESGVRQMSPTAGPDLDADGSGAKPLPFIRPADIYKRIEEERQKERASTDSERPSFDSLAQSPVGDAAAKTPRSRSSSESFSRSAARKPSFERANEGSPFPSSGTPLETVQERKSVYEPVIPTDQGPPGNDQAAPTETLQNITHPAEPSAITSTSAPSNPSASRPMLPQINPSSGFGDEIWSMTNDRQQTEPMQNSSSSSRQPEQSGALESGGSEFSTGLQHQTSLGFRSVVHQAFDRRDDRSVPPTPSSSQDQSLSRDGSSVSRSNTDSTAGISPIMSRASSAANNMRGQAIEARERSTPAIVEEPDGSSLYDSRRQSSGTIQGAQQIPRKPSPSHSRQPSSETAKAFLPGYRRSMDPPSSENSPARTPMLEENKQITPSEVGELSTGTSEVNPVDRWDSAKLDREPNEFEAGIPSEILTESVSDVQRTPQSPVSRAESPSKGRVRDLAGKFNDIQSSSNRSSTESLKLKESNQKEVHNPGVPGVANTASGSSPEQYESEDVQKPRAESVRPWLPGGWVSFAPSEISNSGHDDNQKPEAVSGQAKGSITSANMTSTHESGEEDNSESEARESDPASALAGASVESKPSKSMSNPLTAAAAAGSAMAASIAHATGSNTESDENSEEDDEPMPKQYTVGDIYVRPLAPDRTASSVGTSPVPTPLPKDTPPPTVSQQGAGYFGPPSASSEPSSAHVDQTTILPPSTMHLQQDSENERLQTEIVRQLSPEAFAETGHEDTSYTREDKSEGLSQSVGTDTGKVMPRLAHKFSWENDEDTTNPSKPPAISPLEEPDEEAGAEETGVYPSATPQGSDLRKSLPEMPDSDFDEPIPSLGAIGRPRSSGQDQNEIDSDSDDLGRGLQESAPAADAAQNEQQGSEAAVDNTRPVSSGQKNRIPPFREILAMKLASDRVTTYNRTREQFANLDTGLGEWVTSTLAANPEHASLKSPENRTAASTSAANPTSRHRPSPSILKLGKLPTTGHSQQQSVSSNLGGDEDPPVMSSPTKPSQGGTSRVTSQQVQAKGKDLLKNAGVLGGKATTGAKGLFAKGRNRLQNRGSDKANSPPDSSPTRRFLPSARRSRPSSLAIPTRDASAFESIDSTATSRTIAPRPQSYAAPEAWDMTFRSRVQSPSRLGVLPSPAREIFPQFHDEDQEGEYAEGNEQALLDSIVRHASPPPIISTSQKSAMKKSPENPIPTQKESAITSLPSQQRNTRPVSEEPAQAGAEPDESNLPSLNDQPALQASTNSGDRDIPQVEEPAQSSTPRGSKPTSDERAVATVDNNNDKTARPASGGDLSPPIDSLRPEGPIRTQRSSVSSIEPGESRKNSEQSTEAQPEAPGHRRQVSGFDTETKFSPDVKVPQASPNLTAPNGDHGTTNASESNAQGEREVVSSVDDQPSPEARSRAQNYFARSIPDKPSSPPVHPALRDSVSEITDQSVARTHQRLGSQDRPSPTTNVAEERPKSYLPSPLQSDREHEQAVQSRDSQSPGVAIRHPHVNPPDARYGPFPPHDQDGSRQYVPNDIPSSHDTVTAPANSWQQRPGERPGDPSEAMRNPRSSPHRVISPGPRIQTPSSRYRQPSGDQNAAPGWTGQYWNREAPSRSSIVPSEAGSLAHEHTGQQHPRGHFRGPTNSSMGSTSRPSAWENIGAQRSENYPSGEYREDRPVTTLHIPPDTSGQDATLRRAATSSKTEGGKKKRFSMLGSLFKRSGSTGHAPKQSNKLTKANSSRRSQLAPALPSVQQWAESSAALGPARNPPYPNVPAPVEGPRGTESMTFGPEWQRNAQARGRLPQTNGPPAEGYYAPNRTRDSDMHPSQSRIQTIQDSQENLYNPVGTAPRGYPDSNPGSVRYGPSNPPSLWSPNTSSGYLPSRSQSYSAVPPPGQYPSRSQHRQSSASSYSGFPQPSPQSSLTTPPLDSHPSSPYTISPVQASSPYNPMLQNPSFAPPDAVYAPKQNPQYQQDQRVYQQQMQSARDQQPYPQQQQQPRPRWGSLSSVVAARLPPQPHPGQQTPWEVQIPDDEGPDAELYRRPAGDGRRGRGMPYPGYPGYGRAQEGRGWGPPVHGGSVGNGGNGGFGGYGGYVGQRQRQRQGSGQMQPRRMTGEEEVVMRGSSYPGQEWAPEGLAQGWD